MPWFKVDDNLAFHAKTVTAGNSAMGLWVRAGSWCAQQLTDGVVPRHMVVALGGTSTHAKRLVEAGLWHAIESGYRFHQWEQRQPSADEVRAEQAARHEKKAAAGRLGGIASGVARRKHERSNAEANGKQNEAPTRPDPTRGSSTSDLEGEVELPDDRNFHPIDEEVADAARRTLRAVVSGWPEADPDELAALA